MTVDSSNLACFDERALAREFNHLVGLIFCIEPGPGLAESYSRANAIVFRGADTSRIVRYLGFYDPLKGCSNPFARFPTRDGSG